MYYVVNTDWLLVTDLYAAAIGVARGGPGPPNQNTTKDKKIMTT